MRSNDLAFTGRAIGFAVCDGKGKMLFDHFDQIRIINLASRRDRRRAMDRQLAKVGLAGDPRVEYFSALSFSHPGPFGRTGAHGAFKSHFAVLQDAAAKDSSVLILEDDCDFLPAIETYRMPEHWDVFYGGYEASDPHDLHGSNIIGAHFMGFSPRAAQRASAYLERLLAPDFRPDPDVVPPESYDTKVRPPIDGALVWFRREHPELVTVFAMLSEQRASRTDIGDTSWFDRIPVLRTGAEALRRLVR